MRSILLYALAAAAEISGCYAVWTVLRSGTNVLWLVPGFLALLAFAWLLTLVAVADAGRAYAAYGGIYIGMSVLFMSLAGTRPDRWDLVGAGICLAGSAVILMTHRA